MKLFSSIFIIMFMFVTLFAETINEEDERLVLQKLQYEGAVALYVDTVSAGIAQQLSLNSDFKYNDKIAISIMPIVDIYDHNRSSLATIKIAESLIHEMFIRGFKVKDELALKRLHISSDKQGLSCILYSTFTNYKDGMIINSRIIDEQTSLVHSSARVFISKKELRSIDKIYNKYSWFSENKK